MTDSRTFSSRLSETDFETLSAAVLAQAPHMTAAQMLDLADQLHELIRSRRTAERSLARRHAARSGGAGAGGHVVF